MRTKILICVCVLLLTPKASLAKIGVFGLGGLGISSISTTKIDPTASDLTISSGNSFYGGVGAELGIFPMFNVELDVLFLSHKATLVSSLAPTSSTTLTTNSMQIPIIIKFQPIDYIGIGIGGYYDMYQGSVSTEVNNGGTVTTSTDTYEASNLSKSDFGIVTQLDLRFPIGLFFIGADFRYNIGLSNLSTSTSYELKASQIQLALKTGVSF